MLTGLLSPCVPLSDDTGDSSEGILTMCDNSSAAERRDLRQLVFGVACAPLSLREQLYM